MGYSNFMESDSYKYEIVDTLVYDNYSGDGITFSLLTAGQETLAALDGIREYTDKDDCIFCHPGLFIAGAKTLETCHEMAKYSLNH